VRRAAWRIDGSYRAHWIEIEASEVVSQSIVGRFAVVP
jgi:hypothetical protein